MSVRKPSRTVTRTYLYLTGGKFPANVRYVDKREGVDLKHEAGSLEEATRWMTDSSSHLRRKRRNARRTSRSGRG